MRWRAALGAVAVSVGLACPEAVAQTSPAALYGRVTDGDGRPLAGVTVALTEHGLPPSTQVTDGDGWFHFLGLRPGGYSLKAELPGYATSERPRIHLRGGENAEFELVLRTGDVGGDEVTTRLTSSPVSPSGLRLRGTELDKIPTARDPWAILQQTPGVLLDRINVGGNETGEPALFTGPGAGVDEHVFMVDGVVVTDMGAAGVTPTYYDFGAFEEMQLTTGGTKVTLSTGGVTMDVTTPHGTNEWRGSGRFLQGEDARETGVSFAGPLRRDRVWFWGSYSKQDAETALPDGVRLDPSVQTFNAKLDGNLSPDDRVGIQWLRYDYERSGSGTGPSRPVETTWQIDQPTDVFKVEAHAFRSRFYVTGLAAFLTGGTKATPQGGLDTPVFIGADGVFRDSFASLQSDRDGIQGKLEAGAFFDTGSFGNRLSLGSSFRRERQTLTTEWPAGGRLTFETGSGQVAGLLAPVIEQVVEGRYTSAWVQDTLTFGRFTVDLGLRYDSQDGANGASSLTHGPLASSFVPSQSFGGADSSFDWQSITPRVGITYALGKDRQTLLRAGYSRFAQQLGLGTIGRENPVDPFSYRGFALFGFTDLDRDRRFDANEPRAFGGIVGGGSARDPSYFRSPDLNDPSLSPATTDELSASVEHALRTGFVVGLHAVRRTVADVLEERDLIGGRVATRQDYVQQGRRSGTGFLEGIGSIPYDVPVFSIAPPRLLDAGTLLTNGDRRQEYRGLTLGFDKRLANRWMLRGHLTYSDWTWSAPPSTFEDPNDAVDPSDNDGAPFAARAFGSKRNVFLSSSWSTSVAGLVELFPERPWAFDLGLSLYGRQGFPSPPFLSVTPTDGAPRELALAGFDAFRNDDVFLVNLGGYKTWKLGRTTLHGSLEGFNLLGARAILQRELDQSLPRAGVVSERLGPRVLRLGARLSWR